MACIQKICLISMVFSIALSYSLEVTDHDHHDHHDHHSHHEHYDHKDYLNHWNFKDDHDDVYHHNHYHNIDTHKIHAHLHSNTKKLEEIHALLQHNKSHNHRQDQMLQENRDLINKQIDMQAQDALRDEIQINKLDNAIGQRKDIRYAVDKNKKHLKDVKAGQTVTMVNQSVIDKKLDNVNKKVYHTLDQAKNNSKSLDNLHYKADAQSAALAEHDARLQHHMKDHEKHDKKLSQFMEMHQDHDNRQNYMMDQVLVNQSKLNHLKAGQSKTQQMIAQHDENVKNHAMNMNDFKNSQMAFNGYAAAQMSKADKHIKSEKAHMMEQKDHMDIEKHHMKMEALHMAESEDFYNKAHKHYIYKNQYHYKPQLIRMVKPVPTVIVGESSS